MQRCPYCSQGPVFRGVAAMYKSCPVCHTVFEREPGYFMGAMYVSYPLAVAVLTALFFLGRALWPEVNGIWLIVGSCVLLLPAVPVIYRYSRVIWMYFDTWAWPPGADSHR